MELTNTTSTTKVLKSTRELITSVASAVPSKGTNAGKQMFVINGKYWSKTEPKQNETHVCLNEVEVNGKNYTNVVGFTSDTRMTIDEKIKVITQHEVGFSMAIATLLK